MAYTMPTAPNPRKTTAAATMPRISPTGTDFFSVRLARRSSSSTSQGCRRFFALGGSVGLPVMLIMEFHRRLESIAVVSASLLHSQSTETGFPLVMGRILDRHSETASNPEPRCNLREKQWTKSGPHFFLADSYGADRLHFCSPKPRPDREYSACFNTTTRRCIRRTHLPIVPAQPLTLTSRISSARSFARLRRASVSALKVSISHSSLFRSGTTEWWS